MADDPELLATVEDTLTDQGWRLDRTEASPGVYQVAALDPETDRRHLIAVIPNPDATVQTDHCTWLAAQAEETAAEDAELVTAGTVPEDVAAVAEEHDVSILDPSEWADGQPVSTAVADSTSQQSSGGAQSDTHQSPAGQQRSGRSGDGPANNPGQPEPGQHPAPQQQDAARPRAAQEGTTPQQGAPQSQTAQQGIPQSQTAQQGSPQPQAAQQGAPQSQTAHQGATQSPAQSGAPPQGTAPSQQPGPANSQPASPPANAQRGGISNWGVSRLLTIGGGILAGVSLFLPWVVSIEGSQSWNGMATEFSVLVMIPALLVVLLPAASWGSGWGRLSALVTLVIGGLMAAGGFVVRAALSETVTTGTIELDGQTIPMAVVEGGVGLDAFMLAGVLVMIASIGGLLGSFQS